MWGWSAAGIGERAVRPVGVAIDGTGALLIADDAGNTVWRVAAADGSVTSEPIGSDRVDAGSTAAGQDAEEAGAVVVPMPDQVEEAVGTQRRPLPVHLDDEGALRGLEQREPGLRAGRKPNVRSPALAAASRAARSTRSTHVSAALPSEGSRAAPRKIRRSR